jgi:outer membrane murein-binding lipoprotein Lpp
MRIVTGVVVLSVMVFAGCARQTETPVAEEVPATVEWLSVEPEEMTDAQKAQHERCLAAVNSLASEMMGELMAAMDAGGPTEAIGVCQNKAPAVAMKVADEFDVAIGRTSFALRNPANKTPDWAANLVETRVDEPTFLAGPAGELGALLPIKLKAECQMCHGPVETIDEEVQAAIDEAYPDDQATGFAEGDLRGWFWVEVPVSVTSAG